jgi:hypothetical protein
MLLEVDEEHDSGTVSILPSSASALPSAPIVIEVSRAVPSCTRSILTEIYLGHAGSWHEMLRMETPRQATSPGLQPSRTSVGVSADALADGVLAVASRSVGAAFV